MHILLLKEISLSVTRPNNTDQYDKKLAFNNNAPFISCISKINNTLTDNAEDLHIVMPMRNLFEYSKNYRKQQEVYGIIIEMNEIVKRKKI